jgi:hypothetical protein
MLTEDSPCNEMLSGILNLSEKRHRKRLAYWRFEPLKDAVVLVLKEITLTNFHTVFITFCIVDQNSSGIVLRLGLNFEYYLTDQLRFYVQGSNILNQNSYEQNSSIVTHGASWLFGFKWALSDLVSN